MTRAKVPRKWHRVVFLKNSRVVLLKNAREGRKHRPSILDGGHHKKYNRTSPKQPSGRLRTKADDTAKNTNVMPIFTADEASAKASGRTVRLLR